MYRKPQKMEGMEPHGNRTDFLKYLKYIKGVTAWQRGSRGVSVSSKYLKFPKKTHWSNLFISSDHLRPIILTQVPLISNYKQNKPFLRVPMHVSCLSYIVLLKAFVFTIQKNTLHIQFHGSWNICFTLLSLHNAHYKE